MNGKQDNTRLLFDEVDPESSTGKRKREGEGSSKNASVLDEMMKDEEKAKERINRKDYWVCPGIVVKVMSKALVDKGYYKLKGVVRKVIDKYCGEIEMLENKHVLRVDQEELETVLPQIGGLVKIVNGAYRGQIARLLSIDTDRFCAKVQIEKGVYDGRVLKAVELNVVFSVTVILPFMMLMSFILLYELTISFSLEVFSSHLISLEKPVTYYVICCICCSNPLASVSAPNPSFSIGSQEQRVVHPCSPCSSSPGQVSRMDVITVSTQVFKMMTFLRCLLRLYFAMWHDIFPILDELIEKQGFGIADRYATWKRSINIRAETCINILKGDQVMKYFISCGFAFLHSNSTFVISVETVMVEHESTPPLF
ncbi:hypothetical protein SASPL_147564 [Salvia splendens]|uniref:KOW domain-containing protein n=1 Tax=Salvia splendens TaxID=180675 RepID=A0A8X8WEP7_SALSN|nr:hypothetical protein SASPL_147564 [Salvia splendens]